MAAGLCRKINRAVSGSGNGAIYPLTPDGPSGFSALQQAYKLANAILGKTFCSLLLAFGNICLLLLKGRQLALFYLTKLEKQNVAEGSQRRRHK